jgi:bacillithiol biosynthesis deacetylase BshB1
MSSENRYDLIAVGAHPDDVEVGTGGVLLKMAQMGYRTGIIYLTKGEMGTGGTPEIRARESLTAAQIMKSDLLETLDLGDTKLVDTPENRNIVAGLIRKYQPTLLLAPWPRGGHGKRASHADHLAASSIAMNACYYATFKKLPIAGEPFHVSALFHYFLPVEESPTFVVDITEQFDGWIAALSAHESQFLNPEKPKTRDYLWNLETMARNYGNMIGVKYGQGFKIGEPMAIDDLFCLVKGERAHCRRTLAYNPATRRME